MNSSGRRDRAVPDPWALLHDEMPDVVLLREPIAEPGRYYDQERAIVLRSGLSIEAERRYLWHELVHARRRDAACTGWVRERMERSVEREAARLAMPVQVMAEQASRCSSWHDFVWHMKVPESWVRFRFSVLHPAERAIVKGACWWAMDETA